MAPSAPLFGFLKPLERSKAAAGSAWEWTRKKANCDISNKGQHKYWRIHDNLYDLSTFDHPGGSDWLTITRGNDVTELFESSHPNMDKTRQLLSKYLVCPAGEKRNSGAFTFEKDGFYNIFRSRAWEVLKKSGAGPTSQMLLIHDSLLVVFLALMVAVTDHLLDKKHWMAIAVVTGVVLQCLGTVSHNFYHKKTNWRMFSWDLTPYSSFEWRISHCYSHHVFPNTAYDYEVLVFEPLIHYFPVPKSFLRNLFAPVVYFILTTGGMHAQVSFACVLTTCPRFLIGGYVAFREFSGIFELS
jgi:hypothetical protein